MATSGSQIGIESRRQPTPIYDTGGSLHVNPHRTRTPRTFSITSPTVMLDDIEKNVSPVANGRPRVSTTSITETTPLMSAKERLEANSFSEDSLRSRSRPRKSLKEMLRSIRWAPRDAAWRTAVFRIVKISALFIITIVCCLQLMITDEEEKVFSTTIVEGNQTYVLDHGLCADGMAFVHVQMFGPFYETNDDNDSAPQFNISLNSEVILSLKVNETTTVFEDKVKFTADAPCCSGGNCSLTAQTLRALPVSWHTRELSWHTENKVVYAFLVLVFVYILIMFELVHRTLAALLGALAAIAVLASINERPTLTTIMEWIDMDTMTLLFGMMIIVGIFAETGFFDFSALVAYKLAKGKVWPLITLLCVFSAVVSAFLDNVTTILLVAPVTIRLCEVLNLEPQRILIAEVLFSNIGGTATAIGDPPNVIIVGALSSRGITFTEFTVHAFPGIVLVSLAGYGLLRLYYRNMDALKNKDPADIAEMKHEQAMWVRAAGRIQVVTREETLMRALFMQKAVETEHALHKTLHRRRREESQDLRETIKKLETQYCIKDHVLLVKSMLVVLLVILFLFMYSFVKTLYLDIGWISVLGAIWLLVLADIGDFDGILHKVEWGTLLFFAALFILMEALAELGLIKTIGDVIADIIVSVDESHRLMLALFVILWVSAISSSFIDNIPFTTAMVPVLVQLTEDPHVNLPLVPLVMALAFGACLGGNGTLIGASCNVVCAGIAEQHGYGFSFWDFFKIGFPMMLVTTLASTAYVLLCHVALNWNYA
ncbi:hypothetical protein BsWGS_18018 [Bradybaena similaris]